MTYSKINFVDRQVSRPKTYTMTTNSDNSVTLTDSFGTITTLGTPLNAENMNHIEDGITNSATIDLDNLSNIGQAKFDDKTNIDLDNLSETGQAIIDGKVSKAGDTMTGDLTISKSGPRLIKHNTDTEYTANSVDRVYNDWFDYTTTTAASSNEYLGGTDICDKNSKGVGGYRLRYTTGGQIQSQIWAQRSVNGTAVSANFTCAVDSSGKKQYSPVQLITTYVSGTSGYNIWSNGYCEQWGRVSVAVDSTATVSLTKTYNNTNYNILTSQYSSTNISNAGDTIGAYPNNASQIIVWHGHYGGNNATNIYWLTKGYLADGEY